MKWMFFGHSSLLISVGLLGHLKLKAVPPVCEPRWAWWREQAPLCRRCRDTGFVQRPHPAALAACGWRWCGVVFWPATDRPGSAWRGWCLWRSHITSPSSLTLLYLFSGGRIRDVKAFACMPKILSGDNSLAPISWVIWHDAKKRSGLKKLVRAHYTKWVSQKRGITLTSWFPLPPATWELLSFSCQKQNSWEKDTRNWGICLRLLRQSDLIWQIGSLSWPCPSTSRRLKKRQVRRIWWWVLKVYSR